MAYKEAVSVTVVWNKGLDYSFRSAGERFLHAMDGWRSWGVENWKVRRVIDFARPGCPAYGKSEWRAVEDVGEVRRRFEVLSETAGRWMSEKEWYDSSNGGSVADADLALLARRLDEEYACWHDGALPTRQELERSWRAVDPIVTRPVYLLYPDDPRPLDERLISRVDPIVYRSRQELTDAVRNSHQAPLVPREA